MISTIQCDKHNTESETSYHNLITSKVCYYLGSLFSFIWSLKVLCDGNMSNQSSKMLEYYYRYWPSWKVTGREGGKLTTNMSTILDNTVSGVTQ